MRARDVRHGLDHEQLAPEYLGRLYEANALPAYRFAYLLTGRREVAEDLVQDAFLQLARSRRLRDRAAFPAYLRRTVLNLSRAYFRRHAIEQRALRLMAVPEMPQRSPTMDVDEQEFLWKALQRLPFRQRAALVLRYFEDLSESAAALALGTSLPAIKALTARGLKTLRRVLDEEG